MLKVLRTIILTPICLSPWIILAFLSIYLVWDTKAEWLPEHLRKTYTSGFFFMGIGISLLALMQLFVAAVGFYFGKDFKKIFRTTVIEGMWEAIPDIIAAFFCGIWLGAVSTSFQELSDNINKTTAAILIPLLLTIFIGEYFKARNRIKQIRTKSKTKPSFSLRLLAYLQSIVQLIFWVGSVYAIIFLFDQYAPLDQEDELTGLILILIILGYTWCLKEVLKRLEDWLFKQDKIDWISGY